MIQFIAVITNDLSQWKVEVMYTFFILTIWLENYIDNIFHNVMQYP